MAGDLSSTARRLHSFVTSACTDAGFRRELQTNPRLALARHGLAWEAVPGGLCVPSGQISVEFGEHTLVGAPPERLPGRCPAAERLETKLCLWRGKPMLLDHGPEQYAADSAHWYRSRGLFSLLSPYEFEPVADPSKGGYANSMSRIRPARSGSGAWRSVLAAWEEERVLLGWLCLLFGWDEFLGNLLGYPACCAAAFAKRWERASEFETGDVAPLILQEAGERPLAGAFGWETNIFARYFGAEIVQHFPCRLDCRNTAALARRNLAAWSAFEPSRAAEVRELLSSPVIYAPEDGVALFPGGRLTTGSGETGLLFDIERVLVTNSFGGLKEMLGRSGGRVTASRGGLSAGGAILEAWLVDFSAHSIPLANRTCAGARGDA